MHMRVEREEQTPSGPFWMGCERNIKEYEQVKKAPYTDFKSGSNINKSNYILNILVSIGAALKLYSLIT